MMKVRLVCYEDINAWIIGKFAIKLNENLNKFGVSCEIGDVPTENADINHHILYGGYECKSYSIDTLMITHIDEPNKVGFIKKQLQTAKMGICMSKETMLNLASLGVPRSKLCYINPAHDGIIKPRKLVIGITSRVYKDGRKREFMIGELAKLIDPEEFAFKIMGEFWNPYIEELKRNNFNVEYHEKFDYDEYIKLIPSLDYYLYTGMDEGQMGFIDALAAGVKTIVTPQGYHLDAKDGITYPFRSLDELVEIFRNISKERKKLTNSISTWNWSDYSKKHLEVWRMLYAINNGLSYNFPEVNYSDGICSASENNEMKSNLQMINRFKIYKRLLSEKFKHYYNLKTKRVQGY